jgi:membrane protease YdiL (CAAX protease family)
MTRFEHRVFAPVFLLAAAALLALGAWLATRATEPIVAFSLDASATAVFFALLTFSVAALSSVPFPKRLGLGRGRLRGGATAILAFGLLCTSQALDTLIRHAQLAPDGVLAHIETTLGGARGWHLALAILAVGIAPAVGEELFFRGFLQRGLTNHVRAAGAIAISAVAFGIAHLDPVQGAAAAVLGFYLGTVAHLAGGIRPAIACHAVNNLVAVLATALAHNAPGLPLALVPVELLLGAGAIGLTLSSPRFRVPARTQPTPERTEPPAGR